MHPLKCSEWCKLFLKAATAAEGMQEALRQYPSDNLGMDSLGIDEAPCPGMLIVRYIWQLSALPAWTQA